MSILRLEGIEREVGTFVILDRIDAAIALGDRIGLVGPNGAGKTTLLTAILGLTPFSGRIIAHWEGTGRIAFVPQQFHVDRTLPVTTADFLALTRQKRPVCFGIAAPAQKRISLLLDRVGLKGFESRLLSVLSGGELRRVLLANALDPLPELLILDEPAGGLDETAARWLDDTLVSLKGEMSVVMVSHDSEQVRRIADDVTVLERAHG